MNSRFIQTVISPIESDELGLTLPHEHLFTDLRGPNVPDYAQGEPAKVLSTLKPFLDELISFGVTGLVECSTMGVGRNPQILKEIAMATRLNIIAPTGVYREAYVPKRLKAKSVVELSEMWIADIKDGMEGTDIKAGFIKMAVSDEGITEIEAKNLQAAVITAQQTGASIACHTIGGKLAFDVMELLESYGLDLNRFIWAHAQSETDPEYHLRAAEKGTIISIDAIGSGWAPDEDMLEFAIRLIQAGYTDQILLSHDAGWYDPSHSDGHPKPDGIRGYTGIFRSFIPLLRAKGISQQVISQITIGNPGKIFTLSY